jgi:hypothetical protein
LNNLMIEALKTNSEKYKNKDDVYFRIGAVEDYIINENPSLLRNKKIKREIGKIEDYSKKCF